MPTVALPTIEAGEAVAGTFTLAGLKLQQGGFLPEVRTAYFSRGTLAPDGCNAILVAHGYTGGPDMITDASHVVDGSWSELIGPGRAIDTDRWFVICANALGSSYGSTNAASIDPATGQPWGSSFPEVRVADIVAVQKALLDHLGVKHLVAVTGHSFGGAQVFQWGVDHPHFMDALVPVICAPAMPGADVAALQAELQALPDWRGGDYYGRGDLTAYLTRKRASGLRAFGADAVLADQSLDTEQRTRELQRLAAEWARTFDANSLLILFRAMAAFDVRDRLGEIRAPLLLVLSRSDKLVPAAKAPLIMAALESAGVDARYFEIDSDHGHCASGSDAAKWSGALADFLRAHGRR
ncbi:MAG TPA: alpha/beta fold hydrolase [Ramlibacter sp.]|uniref:alpha/beta fold hydrolase n=1 Tax=Ramlibacter sp. TaxID=1917967 RepID=UPI002D1037A4|nr:alpha/beta fold hydrolase [Ramlibacter sp.]HVZ45741.1 alpha/beta fold hydrolase [Ramlibacter sp.]